MDYYAFDLLSYFAGILDGEGCIAIGKNVNRFGHQGYNYALYLSVGNSKEALIDFLLAKFGGSVSYRKPSGQRKRDFWVWSLLGREAEELLKAIRNFSVCKKEEIDVVLRFRSTFFEPGANQHTIGMLDALKIREECFIELQRLHNKDRN